MSKCVVAHYEHSFGTLIKKLLPSDEEIESGIFLFINNSYTVTSFSFHTFTFIFFETELLQRDLSYWISTGSFLIFLYHDLQNCCTFLSENIQMFLLPPLIGKTKIWDCVLQIKCIFNKLINAIFIYVGRMWQKMKRLNSYHY